MGKTNCVSFFPGSASAVVHRGFQFPAWFSKLWKLERHAYRDSDVYPGKMNAGLWFKAGSAHTPCFLAPNDPAANWVMSPWSLGSRNWKGKSWCGREREWDEAEPKSLHFYWPWNPIAYLPTDVCWRANEPTKHWIRTLGELNLWLSHWNRTGDAIFRPVCDIHKVYSRKRRSCWNEQGQG